MEFLINQMSFVSRRTMMVKNQINKSPSQFESPEGLGPEQLLLLAYNNLAREQPLLATKLRIPRQSHAPLKRQRLIDILGEVFTQPITLIYASAGSGKTTLLCEWAANCGRQLGWLTLDHNDNELVRFWEYFIGAIQTIDSEFGGSSLAILRSRIPNNLDLFLTTLLNDINSLPGEFAVVLDDFHLIDSEAILNSFAYVCEHLPDQIHLVISSRTRPPLPLARMRARGQLIEINQDELNFTASEAEEYIHQIEKMSLSELDITWLHRKTEGWIAGIKLAALSIKKQDYPSEFIHDLTGSNYYISDYLIQEVLRQQSTYIQDFLLRTSILDRLCISLCDAVTQSSVIGNNKLIDPAQNSQSILEYLDKANIFIQALDEEHQWYRYHHLFADLLRENLLKSYPNLLPELYRKAGEWYEANGFCSDAVQMALAGKDYEHAADLIECNCQKMTMRSEMNTLLNWIEVLPVEMVRERPKLCLAKAWGLLSIGKLAEVADNLQYIESIVSHKGDSESKIIFGECAALRTLVAVIQYQAHQIIAFSQQAIGLLPDDNHFLNGLISLCQGVAYNLTGDLSTARACLSTVVELPLETSNLLLVFLGNYYLAKILNKEGRLHQSAKILQELLEETRTPSGTELPIASLAHVSLASLLYEWNELDAALNHIKIGLDLSRYWWIKDNVNEAYVTLARVMQAFGDDQAALDALSQAVKLTDLDHARPFITHEAILNLRTWIQKGYLSEAIAWAENYARSFSDEVNIKSERLWEAPAAAHLLFASGQQEQAQRLLKPLLSSAEAFGLNRQVIEVDVLQALMLSAQKKSSQAILVLSKALELAEQEGYVRMFIDEGTPMLELLKQAQQHGIAPSYTEKLLAAFGDQEQNVSLGTPMLVEPLSERELQVLSLLSEGFSPKQISEQLVITVGTARGHLHKIYSKLQVGNQLQAVQRANELNII